MSAAPNTAHARRRLAAEDARSMPAVAVTHAAARLKRLSTCQARAALSGAVLTAVDGDEGRPHYVLTRWALTKRFDDLAHVEAFLEAR